MRVPLSWLAEHVEVELTPEALAERLTLLGMEVKSIERWGADWRHVVVGELLTVTRHPRADRLSLTTVSVGAGEPLEVVCGATNIAPGQRVPVALPGAVLPGDRRIDRTEKLGVVSNGMLCSGDELRLTADAEGILILPAETPIGARLVDLYGDVVLDVDVKPNRGDALSIVGLAREVAALTGGRVRLPVAEVAEAGAAVAERLDVTVEAADLCSRFVGRWVSGVRVGPSPDRIQMRLLAAGMRPISNVVDASNYVMLELGKPIHAFDAAAVRDGRIIVRRARPGERLETLDHVERDLDPETLLIADADGPLAIAGVMGGAASEVSSATTDVIIESAIFSPVGIRRTAFRYALRSEASLRFEKGQEHGLARLGADRTARLIAEWAGGQVAPGVVDTAPEGPPARRVAFRPARVDRLLGVSSSPAEQQAVLARVGISTTPAPSGVDVDVVVAAGPMPLTVRVPAPQALVADVPPWRRDLEVEADIAEEVARIGGYDRVPTILPDTPMPAHRPSPLEVRDHVRRTLAGAGLIEVVGHALVPPADAETLAWTRPDDPAFGEDAIAGAPIRLRNPLSNDHAALRRSLLGNLLGVADANARRGSEAIAVFEVGKGYGDDAGEAREWWRLGLLLAGSFDVRAWNRPARPADLEDAKGLVALLAASLGFSEPRFAALTDEPHLHPGRSATVVALDDAGRFGLSGRIGEVHPALVAARDLRLSRPIVGELSVRWLSGGQIPVVRSNPPPRFPGIERDLALLVGEDRAAAEIEDHIRAAAGGLLRTVRLFDVYRGAPLPPHSRSLAFRLLFAAERTLTEAEVDAVVDHVVAGLEVAGIHRRA